MSSPRSSHSPSPSPSPSASKGPNVDFYLGMSPSKAPGYSRTGFHSEILQWDNDVLEHEHCFIQWLFPILGDHRSQGAGVNSRAWYLSPREAGEFGRNREIQGRLIESLRRMLAFYGAELVEVKEKEKPEKKRRKSQKDKKPVEEEEREEEEVKKSAEETTEGEEVGMKKKWRLEKREDFTQRMKNLTWNTHNYLRISRMMTCLSDVEMHEFAFAIAEFFFDQNQTYKFPRSTLKAWDEIVKRDRKKVDVPQVLLDFSPDPKEPRSISSYFMVTRSQKKAKEEEEAKRRRMQEDGAMSEDEDSKMKGEEEEEAPSKDAEKMDLGGDAGEQNGGEKEGSKAMMEEEETSKDAPKKDDGEGEEATLPMEEAN